MNKEIIGIEYTMRPLAKGNYALIDNASGCQVCVGTEEQIEKLFTEQNDRVAIRIGKRIDKEVKNPLRADVILDGGDNVFREVALGKCYHAIIKMIKNGQIDKKQGAEIMAALELYAFNSKTPIPAESGREYYQRYKNTRNN